MTGLVGARRVEHTVIVKHRRGPAVTQAILGAALEIIAESGSLVISMDDVAARASVNKTTVYRRWSSSQDLVKAAVLAQVDTNVPIPETGDARQDLIVLCHLIAANLGSPIGRTLSSAASSSTNGELDRIRNEFWASRLGLAMEVLDRAGGSGVVSSDVAIEWLVGPIHFRVSALRREVDDAYIVDLVDGLLRRVRK